MLDSHVSIIDIGVILDFISEQQKGHYTVISPISQSYSKDFRMWWDNKYLLSQSKDERILSYDIY